MPRLVYWYGTPHWDNLSYAFSFLHPNEMITYDEGVKMGLNKRPKVEDNGDLDTKLSEHEEFLVDGLEELENEIILFKS